MERTASENTLKPPGLSFVRHPHRKVRSTVGLAATALIAGVHAQPASIQATPRALQGSSAARAPNADIDESKLRATWHELMVRLRLPKPGCFVASFPAAVWTEIACVKTPTRPPGPVPVIQRKNASHTKIVGASYGDITAGVDGYPYTTPSSNPITSAEASFPIVTGVENISTGGTFGVFSLQLNSATFTSTAACSKASDVAGCSGWAQFVVATSTDDSYAYIEYWLLDGAPCSDAPKLPDLPGTTPWIASGKNCYFDSPPTPMPPLLPSQLSLTTVVAAADAQGYDAILVTRADGTLYSAGFPDGTLKLAQNWWGVEFNVFGYNNGRRAMFSAGSALLVKLTVSNGTTLNPTLSSISFSGETNNLTAAHPGCAYGGEQPYIEFEEAYRVSQLSNQCPPTLPPHSLSTVPPPLPPSCAQIQLAISLDKKLQSDAQNELDQASCKGKLKLECENQAQQAGEVLTGAEQLYKKYCSSP